MRYETWKKLDEIRAATQKDFGKVVQKLLALTLLELGATRVTDRAIQGIDIEARLDDRDLAMEVKTGESSTVRVGSKDLKGLDARRSEGYTTLLAVLGGRLIDDWQLLPVPGTDLKLNSDLEVTFLRPYMDRALGDRVSAAFVEIVDRYGIAAATGGQLALNAILEQHEHYALA